MKNTQKHSAAGPSTVSHRCSLRRSLWGFAACTALMIGDTGCKFNTPHFSSSMRWTPPGRAYHDHTLKRPRNATLTPTPTPQHSHGSGCAAKQKEGRGWGDYREDAIVAFNQRHNFNRWPCVCCQGHTKSGRYSSFCKKTLQEVVETNKHLCAVFQSLSLSLVSRSCALSLSLSGSQTFNAC